MRCDEAILFDPRGPFLSCSRILFFSVLSTSHPVTLSLTRSLAHSHARVLPRALVLRFARQVSAMAVEKMLHEEIQWQLRNGIETAEDIEQLAARPPQQTREA